LSSEALPHDVLTLLAAVQYADSGYPAGGYAHSFGLEAAVAEGAITDAAGLEAAIIALLTHQLAPADAVAAAACAHCGTDPAAFAAVDRRLLATRAAREPRQAALNMGQRLLATAAAEHDPALAALAAAVRNGETPGNWACVLGALLGRRGLRPEAAAALTLWLATNGLLAAAIRLLPLTHDDVQRILVGLRPRIAVLAREAAAADPLQMAGAAPQWELWAMRHEVATVRLFAS